MDVFGALSVVRQTIDITRELRNVDEKIDAATWKLRLSEIIDRLIDAKDALIEEKDEKKKLREEIDALKARLSDRGTFEDENGLLFRLDEEGNRIKSPFCNLCYARDDKLIRLRHYDATNGGAPHFLCDSCKTTIVTGPYRPFPNAPRRRSIVV